jgi:hypothetical protein
MKSRKFSEIVSGISPKHLLNSGIIPYLINCQGGRREGWNDGRLEDWKVGMMED